MKQALIDAGTSQAAAEQQIAQLTEAEAPASRKQVEAEQMARTLQEAQALVRLCFLYCNSHSTISKKISSKINEHSMHSWLDRSQAHP